MGLWIQTGPPHLDRLKKARSRNDTVFNKILEQDYKSENFLCDTLISHRPVFCFLAWRRKNRKTRMAAAAMVLDPKSSLEPPASFPSMRSELQGLAEQSSDEDDLYSRLKSLQRQLEFIDIQEEYVKDEQKNLKRELLRAQEEVKRIQSVPLVIGQFMEMVDQNNGIVGSTTGSNYYVRILSTINRELLKPSASVALHRHSNALVDVLPPEADSSISLLSQSEKPDVTYNVSFTLFCFRKLFEFA